MQDPRNDSLDLFARIKNLSRLVRSQIIMNRLTLEQRYQIIKIYFEIQSSIRATYRRLHFWLNGFVNKQNCRIWNENNPQEILQREILHYIQKNAPFGAVYTLVASSDLISSKMRPRYGQWRSLPHHDQ